MYNWQYTAEKIAIDLGGNYIKGNMTSKINCVSTISAPVNNSMIFVTASKWKDEYLEKLKNIIGSLIIIEDDIKDLIIDKCKFNDILVVENARLYFAKALDKILRETNVSKRYKTLDNFIVVGENVEIGENCIIEPFCFIDHNVTIGNNVYIKTGAKIKQHVYIGNNVVIGENTVIGAQGFGIEKEKDGSSIRIPHIGGVRIGDGCEIGALTSIVSGTIYPTYIHKNCFIDDLIHIAHNCMIGEGTFATACSQFSGSVKVGKNGYISPNATLRNGIELGDNCFVGQASSVQKSFDSNINLVGNPAKEFSKK